MTRPGCDKWYVAKGFVDVGSFPDHVMVAHVIAVIGREDDNGVVSHARCVEVVDEFAHLGVDVGDHAPVNAAQFQDVITRVIVFIAVPFNNLTLSERFVVHFIMFPDWCGRVNGIVHTGIRFADHIGWMWVGNGEPEKEGVVGTVVDIITGCVKEAGGDVFFGWNGVFCKGHLHGGFSNFVDTFF